MFPRSADLGLIEALLDLLRLRNIQTFPRSADLGLIEACQWVITQRFLPCFRDQLISASLKRSVMDVGLREAGEFPRSADLGLIEAFGAAASPRSPRRFPRSADLGLIEAR